MQEEAGIVKVAMPKAYFKGSGACKDEEKNVRAHRSSDEYEEFNDEAGKVVKTPSVA